MPRAIANRLAGTKRRSIRKWLISAFICVVTGCCISSYGQTNQCPPRAVPFFLPHVQLRTERRVEALKAEPLVSGKPVSETPPQMTAADVFFGAGDLHGRAVRSDRFYLTEPEPISNDPIVRIVDNIFTPEIVHIGKTPVTCSVVTAIKRKNPFCLLNPIFFQASW